MFHLYTESARRTLLFARQEASDLGGSAIETEHFLIGLMQGATGFVEGVFATAGLSQDGVRGEIRRRFPGREMLPTSAEMPFSSGVLRILEVAARESERRRHGYIGSRHLLLGIVDDASTFASTLLREHGIRPDVIRERVFQRDPTSRRAPGSLTADDITAVTCIIDRFVQFVVACDFAGAARLYTPEATVMPPDHPAVTGRVAIEAWLASLPPVTRFTFEVDAIDGRADIAYVRGRYAATFQSPDGPVDNRGKFLEIRRRQADGSWLMDIDIFNSDLL